MPEEPLEIPAHKSHVNAVAFSPSGDYLASAGMDRLIKLWRPGEWELFSTFFGHRKSANSLSFHPDGELLATSSTDRTVRFWSFPFGREERVEEGLLSALFSPDGSTVASLDRKDRVRLWSLETGQTVDRLEHESRVTALAFEPSGEHLLSAPAGGDLVRWRVEDGEVADRIPGDEVAVAALRFFGDGGRLAASGHEGRIRLYETEGWTETSSIALEADGAFPLAVAPDGDELAVGTDHRVRTFGTADGALRRDLELPCKGVYSVAYAPGGEWLVAAAADKRIRVWER